MAKIQEWFGPTQVLGPQERKMLIEAGAMTKEDFTGRPSPQPQQASPPVGGSSAQADKARALGITVEELRRRQDAQFRELMKKRQGKASGGKVGMEHTHSSTQDQSIEDRARTSRESIKRGMQQWVPDLVGLPGDLADALAYAARKVARGQSEKSVPSLGAGAALRRMVSRSPLRGMASISDPDTPVMEEATRFLNPLMMTSPTKLVKSPLALAALAAATGDATPALPMMAGVIKGRGGNWLNNSVENALKPMLRFKRGEDPQKLIENWENIHQGDDELVKTGVNMITRDSTMDNWIKGPLTKYLKRDLATPEDPIRALAEQGILHFEPEWVPDASIHRSSAREKGLPVQQLGKSRLAQDWEDLADLEVHPYSPQGFKSPKIRKENPWLSQLGDKDIVFASGSQRLPDALKLDHLTDEVYNSLLNGEINPEHLKNGQFSVEAAVRHVAAKNAQRAKDAEKAQIEALQLAAPGKEYPNGYRWVELPDTSTPEARKLCQEIGKAGGWCTGDDWAAEGYGSGGGKLHVLLDKEGRPHAQVHESRGIPEDEARDYIDSVLESVDPELSDKFTAFLESGEPSVEQSLRWILKNIDDVDTAPETQGVLDQLLNVDGKPQITQIKPRANSWESQMVKDKLAEDPEYRNTITPMLQDFVKSGQWSEVEDLDNVGMWKHPQTGAYHTKAEAEADESLDAIYSSRNLDANGNYRHNYADGGLVNFDDLEAFLAPR